MMHNFAPPGWGHGVLLAQDLDNLPGSAGPLQVDHMPPTPTTTATASRPEAKVI